MAWNVISGDYIDDSLAGAHRLQIQLQHLTTGDICIADCHMQELRCWKQVINFESDDTSPKEDSKAVTSYVQEDPVAFKLEPGDELIRDERGVRIARQEPEDSD